MGMVTIVRYRPKAGKDADLVALVGDHLRILQEERLATDRPPIIMRAANGDILEAFEWISPEAIEQAHQNPSVNALWARFAVACEYQPLASLEECQQLFASFEAIN